MNSPSPHSPSHRSGLARLSVVLLALLLAAAVGWEARAEKPKKPRRASRSKKAVAEAVAETAPVAVAEPEAAAEPAPSPAAAEEERAASVQAEASASAHPTRRKPQSIDAPVVPVVSSNVSEEAKAEEKPKRAGWWQRKGFF